MSNRNNTCTKKLCPFFKKYEEQCPNYVVSDWKTPEGHVYTVEDCAPKRSMILCQQIYNQMIDTRQDYNRVRNAAGQLMHMVALRNRIEIGHEDVVDADVKLLKED